MDTKMTVEVWDRRELAVGMIVWFSGYWQMITALVAKPNGYTTVKGKTLHAPDDLQGHALFSFKTDGNDPHPSVVPSTVKLHGPRRAPRQSEAR